MASFMDIVKANIADKEVGLIDEAIRLHPELKLADTRTIPGINYKTLVRTSLGNVGGSFRAANAGSIPPVHTYENRLVETYVDEVRFQSDKAVADAYVDGAAAYIAMEVSGSLEGEMQALARQFYYGAASGLANASGFPGLLDSYDSTNMVVDAGGTTANTGSSCWLLRFGPQQIQWVLGLGGKMSFSPVRVESLFDPADTTNQKKYDGYVQTMQFRPGLQVASLWSACRIKKLTADNGAGLTDALINKALALFKAGTQPDVILCTRRSIQQLQASRTSYNPLGVPAQLPTAVVGFGGMNIPIMATEALLNTEPLTL